MDLWDDGYSGVDPTDFLDEVYNSSAIEPGNGWNIMRWVNPEMDQLLVDAHTLDENKRKEVFCQMAKILDEEVPVALLFTIINADAARTARAKTPGTRPTHTVPIVACAGLAICEVLMRKSP